MNYKEYRKSLKVTTPEQEIQNAIIEWLSYSGCKVFRVNSGQTRVKDEDGNTRIIKLAPAGTPDIVGCVKKTGRMIAVEVKRPGKLPTAIQKEQIQEWRDAGALAFVASSVEDVREWLWAYI